MRVLFILHDTSIHSGATASMLSIIKNIFNDERFDVQVIVPSINGTACEFLMDNNIAFYQLNYSSVRMWSTFKGKEKLRDILRAFKNISISLFSVLLNIKLLRSLNVDVIYTNTSDIYMGFFISKILNKKHFWHIREFGVEDQDRKHIFNDSFLYNFICTNSNKVIVISESLKMKFKKYTNRENIEVVYNDIIKTNIKELVYLDRVYEKNLSLLMVGTISPKKGQHDVINVIHVLKEKYQLTFNLGIVGDDSSNYVSCLKNEVSQLGLTEQVHFLGFRTDADHLRQQYDIGIVASACEAFGRITIEGMLNGLIMVGSNAGANPELIKNEVTGFLYSFDNDDTYLDLERTLIKILERKEMLSSVQRNAYEFALEFTKGTAAGKIKNILLSNDE